MTQDLTKSLASSTRDCYEERDRTNLERTLQSRLVLHMNPLIPDHLLRPNRQSICSSKWNAWLFGDISTGRWVLCSYDSVMGSMKRLVLCTEISKPHAGRKGPGSIDCPAATAFESIHCSCQIPENIFIKDQVSDDTRNGLLAGLGTTWTFHLS